MSTSVDNLMGFQQLQADFCGWIRQPQSDVPENLQMIDIKRLQAYRELLSHNMYQFIDMVFPVAQSMLPTETWQYFCEQFFQQARCQSPFYIDISQQFLEFMQTHSELWQAQWPWLVELLHYEWMELYVELAEYDAPKVTQCLDQASMSQLLPDQLLKIALPVWVLAYQWPIHTWYVEREGQDAESIEQQPTCLLVWRDIEDHIQEQVLTPLMAVLVEYLAEVTEFNLARLQAFLVSQPFAAQLPLEQQQGICLQVLQQLVEWQLLYTFDVDR